MGLVGLICAYHEAAAPGALLRAALPLAGRTLLDRQVRQAAAAGASPLVLLVERLPPELLAAIDRLRAEGYALVVARAPEEAARAIDPFDRLLLVGDGFVAGQEAYAQAAAAEGSVILTVPDSGFDDRHERIDADTRWAGLAATSGAMLRETTAMLRDWDLQSTLLRRVVQNGATQLEAPAGSAIATRAEELAEGERRLLGAGAGEKGRHWASHYVHRRLAGWATPMLASTQLGAGSIAAGAAALAVLGALAAFADHRWAALVLILLSAPLRAIAGRLARLRLAPGGRKSWSRYLIPYAEGAALLGLGYGLGEEVGWGAPLMALITLAFVFAQRVELSGASARAGFWLAEPRGMALLLLPLAAAGQWLAGLSLLFAYAAGSFFWAQRQAHAPASRQGQV